MKIEYARRVLAAINMFDGASRYAVGQEPEITAAGHREVAVEQSDGCKRNFQNRVFGRPEWRSRRCGHSIEIMRDRIDARAVGVAFFRQDLIGPPRSIAH